MGKINIYQEAERCLLCKEAPCTAAGGRGDVAAAIRAIRFGNAARAAALLEGADTVAAEKACIHYDRPLRISEIAAGVPKEDFSGELPSLEIDFCGIRCENPFFLASSAVCTNYEMIARAFEAGWAGVFYKTICLEEIKEVSPRFDALRREGRSFIGFRNMEQLSENPPEVDFDIMRRLKRDYPSKIVIASIMGKDEHEWVSLARKAEEAGLDAVELNFSCPQMRYAGMGSDVGQDPEQVLILTGMVKRAVKIPVIAKMTPNISSMTPVATAAYFAGADGISAINTIKSLTMNPRGEISGKRIISGYSGRAVKPIALRFIAEIAGNPVTKGVQVSGIGGITLWWDALEFIQLGCRNVQVCTAIMEYGQRIVEDLKWGLQHYMLGRGISSLDELVGEELTQLARPSDVDRDSIVYPLVDREKCIGCGRCFISCSDGGHQAISFGTDRTPRLNGAKCVGCHLCSLVCPTGAIGLSKRVPKRTV